jgi:hypothetical protein
MRYEVFDYELTRLGRYGNLRQNTSYTIQEMAVAYWAWAHASYNRQGFWDTYCDVRDSVPWGTNDKIRKDWAKFRDLTTH